MLMLSRKAGEKIFIGDNNDIMVQICRINGNEVIVGIEADKRIPILREEVFLRDAVNSIALNIGAAFSDE